MSRASTLTAPGHSPDTRFHVLSPSRTPPGCDNMQAPETRGQHRPVKDQVPGEPEPKLKDMIENGPMGEGEVTMEDGFTYYFSGRGRL